MLNYFPKYLRVNLLQFNMKRTVLQYDLEGNYLYTWEQRTIRHIAECLSIDETDLSRAINNKIETAGNFQWRVQDRDRVPMKISQAYDVMGSMPEIPIAKYYNDRLISTYNSIKEAAYKTRLDDSGISRCINGEEKQVNGFVFKRIV